MQVIKISLANLYKITYNVYDLLKAEVNFSVYKMSQMYA